MKIFLIDNRLLASRDYYRFRKCGRTTVCHCVGNLVKLPRIEANKNFMEATMRHFALGHLASRKTRRVSLSWRWLALLTVAVITALAANAQLAGTGAISGIVTDSTGAIIPQATVTATSVTTNVKTVRTTTSAGDYNISPLPPGQYSVTVAAKGFETFVQQNVTVNALETVAVNARLSVGAAEQTVTVSTAPPVLDTTDATLGAVMDNQMYTNLPLLMGAGGNADQRRATDFASLMPGVQNTYASNSSSNSTDASGAVNGGNPGGGTSEIYIDGINLPEADGIGDPRFTWTAFGVDSIDQFQVQTVGFSTQYAGQGVQNYSIKQGTNNWHGSVYEYLRNTVLDAWSPSNKTPTVVGVVPAGASCSSTYLTASTSWCKLGGVKPAEIMNEVGTAFGGPIIKNKLFMFYNYGQYRYSAGPRPHLQTVPTLAMMGYSTNGTSLGYADFSGYAAATGYSIYDPATQTVYNCSGANCQRSAFPNNQIPMSRLSAAAQYIDKYMLPYEATANQSLYVNNIAAGYSSGLSNWYQAGRLDYDMTPSNQLSLIVAFGRQASTGPNASGAANALGPPFNTAQAYTPKTNIDIIKDAWTINPHVVNQFSLAFGRYASLSVTPDDEAQYSAATMGLLGTPAGQASFFPGISFSGGVDNVTSEAGYSWNDKTNNTYAIADNVDWQYGKHNITFGGQLIDIQFNYIKNETDSSPMAYTFSANQTEGYASNGSGLPNTGSSFASYMLGAVDTSSVTVGVPGLGSRWLDPSLWVQDDYKITPKVTINGGLRWDFWPAIHEVHNLMTWLNPTGANSLTGNLGTLAFAGGNPSDGYHAGKPVPSSVSLKNLAPRLGIAYAVGPKTVLRASYGLYFARGDWTSGSQSGSPSTTGLTPAAAAASVPSNQPQFYWDGTACTAAAGGNGTVAGDGFTPCGWTGSVNPPTAVLPSGATLAEFGTVETATLKGANSTTLTYWDPYYGSRTPEYENWSAGFERQLTNNMSVSVSYVGSEGHFLSVGSAMYQRNNKLPQSMAALAGYTLTASNGSTQVPCSGNTCLYPVLGQKATTTYLAMAQADGFTPPNPYSNAANYYSSNSVAAYYYNFPQFSGVSDTTSFVGNENWNALEISFRQRPSHGLNFMVNYTWSKNIDDLGTFRVYDNTRLDRSLSTADQPQSLVVTAVYALPIGKGHLWGNNWAYRAIASNWLVSGIGTVHSGQPVVVVGSGCGGSSILNQCEPNLVAGQKGRQYSYGKTASGAKINWDPNSPNYIGKVQYINPAAFTVNIAGTTSTYGTYNGQAYSVGNGPALYVPGNAPRVAPLGMFGQDYTDVDLALKRSIPIYREWALQFELDMTNVANHVVYSPPGVSGTTSTTNTVVQSGSNSGFGTISQIISNPRDVQAALRISF